MRCQSNSEITLMYFQNLLTSKDVITIIYNFLWTWKSDKISRSTTMYHFGDHCHSKYTISFGFCDKEKPHWKKIICTHLYGITLIYLTIPPFLYWHNNDILLAGKIN